MPTDAGGYASRPDSARCAIARNEASVSVWEPVWNQRGRMSPAQRRDLRVGSGLVLFDFVREDVVEINLVLRVLPTLDFEETLVHPTTPSNCSRGF